MSSQQPKPDAELNERKAEATEKETLKDLEEAFGSSNAKKKQRQRAESGRRIR